MCSRVWKKQPRPPRGRARARITEVNAPHVAMISDPGVVTSVIRQAVRATT